MKWLVGPTIAGLVGAVVIVHLVDSLSSGAAHGVAAGTARAGLFVGTWTAISTGTGMRGFSRFVQGLRQKTRSLGGWLNTRR